MSEAKEKTGPWYPEEYPSPVLNQFPKFLLRSHGCIGKHEERIYRGTRPTVFLEVCLHQGISLYLQLLEIRSPTSDIKVKNVSFICTSLLKS